MTIFINEHQDLEQVSPERLDRLLADGWRHFGTSFYRYSLAINDEKIAHVLPLRIRIAGFTPSKSQRRIIKRNRDLEVEQNPTEINPEKVGLFNRHRGRFRHNVPDSILDFLSTSPGTVPCRNDEVCLRRNGLLLGVSFVDIGRQSASAVYAMFEPEESARSLGIQLILAGIDYARQLDLKYYYPGYAYREPSFYDYKKRFSGLEALDWCGGWYPCDNMEEM